MQINAKISKKNEITIQEFSLNHKGKLAIITRMECGECYIGDIVYATVTGTIVSFNHTECWTNNIKSVYYCRLLTPEETVTLAND